MPEIVPIRFDLNLANPLHKSVYDIIIGIDPRERSSWVFMAILLYSRNIAPGSLDEIAKILGSQVQGIEDKIEVLTDLVKQLKYSGIKVADKEASLETLGERPEFSDGADGAFKLE